MLKRIKRIIISITLALTLLFTGVFSIGSIQTKQTSALSPSYQGQNNTIYYAYDFFPSLDYTTLYAQHGEDYTIIYDGCISSASFGSLNQLSYFSGFGENCTVILDIKLFKPEEIVLQNFFAHLLNQNCNVLFLSVYDETAFQESTLTGVSFIKVSFQKLENFYTNLLQHAEDCKSDKSISSSLYNTAILLDGSITNYSTDFSTACSSLAFRMFLDALIVSLDPSYAPTDIDDYAELDEYLENVANVKLLVYVNELYSYVDLCSGASFNLSDVDDFLQESGCNYFFAMGFWAFESDFYYSLDALLDLTSPFYDEEDPFPIYTFEVDPILYSEGGLPLISNSDLDAISGVIDEEEFLILGALSSLL